MQSLRFWVAVVVITVSVSLAAPAPAADKHRPTEQSVEALLRDLLAQQEPALFSLRVYKRATLMDFELLGLEPAASSRWIAEVELLFDFGPPPPSIMGFERQRGGPYELLLQQHGGDFELLRFNPVARVHQLPVSE